MAPCHPNALLERIRASLEESLRTVEFSISAAKAQSARSIVGPRQLAQAYLASMERRAALLPKLNEGAWAMLLDLYVHEGERRISISSACIASGQPPTTALRWIKELIALGLVVRESDNADARRAYLCLSPKGRSSVLTFLAN